MTKGKRRKLRGKTWYRRCRKRKGAKIRRCKRVWRKRKSRKARGYSFSVGPIKFNPRHKRRRR